MAGHAVFDLDGTLVDSVPVMTTILNAMLADRGLAAVLTAERVRPHATAGGLATVRSLLGEACGEPHAALAEFRARYAAIPTPPESLYPGVGETLKGLKSAGVTLAVFSNKSQGLCEKVLGELNLSPLFGAIVGSGPDVPLKPDPTGLDLALALSGGYRERCCFIGDGEPDFVLARAAGVPFILAAWGYGEAGTEWPGAAVAADPTSVGELVLRALRRPVAA
jgi:phosphoglycolate phosphatase